MNLNDVKTAAKFPKRKRVGRGNGSGNGKTAGKGHKGRKARAGGGIPLWYEGGQMPLFRRIPKRGFTNADFKKVYSEVNVDALEVFESGSTVTPADLMAKEIIDKLNDGIKILGRGEIKVPLTVKAHKFSKGAAEKIQAAGGTIEELK